MATTGISAREWGRQQAEAAPLWTDQQWQRECALLRVRVATAPNRADHQYKSEDQAATPERRAA